MTELICDKGLLNSDSSPAVRIIARTRTFTLFDLLDSYMDLDANQDRKGVVVRFLYDAELILGETPVIPLSSAKLTRANLAGLNLEGANLSGTRLMEADLVGANLKSANLSQANLTEASLERANLGKAILDGAWISRNSISKEQLESVESYANVYWIEIKGQSHG